MSRAKRKRKFRNEIRRVCRLARLYKTILDKHQKNLQRQLLIGRVLTTWFELNTAKMKENR